jgi:UTRA domain
MRQQLEARMPDEEIAALLGADVTQLILLLRLLVSDRRRRPLEVADTFYRADRCRYEVVVPRVPPARPRRAGGLTGEVCLWPSLHPVVEPVGVLATTSRFTRGPVRPRCTRALTSARRPAHSSACQPPGGERCTIRLHQLLRRLSHIRPVVGTLHSFSFPRWLRQTCRARAAGCTRPLATAAAEHHCGHARVRRVPDTRAFESRMPVSRAVADGGQKEQQPTHVIVRCSAQACPRGWAPYCTGRGPGTSWSAEGQG